MPRLSKTSEVVPQVEPLLLLTKLVELRHMDGDEGGDEDYNFSPAVFARMAHDLCNNMKPVMYVRTSCWMSSYQRGKRQYPLLSWAGRKWPAHKVVFALRHRGAWREFSKVHPKGKSMSLSHLCGREHCCNYRHLVWERHSQNMDRIKCHNDKTRRCRHEPRCIKRR
jgi:hypothetical protein